MNKVITFFLAQTTAETVVQLRMPAFASVGIADTI